MKIQLDSWSIVNLEISALSTEREENSFDLNLGHFFPEEKTDSFGIAFTIGIKDRRFDLNLKAMFMFSADDKITEEFKLLL
jgi:preprotein translocase subunit SecB